MPWSTPLIALIAALLIMPLPLDPLAIPIEASVPYLHLYTGFRFIAIAVAPLVALGTILLIRRSVREPPGPLRTAAAVAIITAAVTPLVVAAVVGMRALVPGATPLAGSVLELMTIVAVGGLLYWSPLAFAIMGPLLVGAGCWLHWAWQE
jgi:hypothetical protein